MSEPSPEVMENFPVLIPTHMTRPLAVASFALNQPLIPMLRHGFMAYGEHILGDDIAEYVAKAWPHVSDRSELRPDSDCPPEIEKLFAYHFLDYSPWWVDRRFAEITTSRVSDELPPDFENIPIRPEHPTIYHNASITDLHHTFRFPGRENLLALMATAYKQKTTLFTAQQLALTAVAQDVFKKHDVPNLVARFEAWRAEQHRNTQEN